MIKNEFRFEDGLLIIVAGEKEFKLDSNDYTKLAVLDKTFGVNGKDLTFYEKGKQVPVKDYILDFPENRVSFTNQDNTDLRKSNLKCFGLRNNYWIDGDTLVVEDQNGDHFYFDSKFHMLLESLDGRISNNGKGYPTMKVFGKTVRIHRLIAEVVYGELDSKDVVDHIDGNTRNNKIENLRIASLSENGKSRHKTNNKFGFPNIHDIDGEYHVVFNEAPQYNNKFPKLFEAIRYVHVVRPIIYQDYNGTVSNYENMLEAIEKNGGRIENEN